MKKNPLFYAKTNANSLKIGRAKKILMLSIACLMAVFLMTTVSAYAFGGKKAAGKATLCFLPFIAAVKGTKSVNGEDETDAAFALRAGKAEDPEAYVKRYLKFLNDEINNVKEHKELSTELTALKTKIEGMKPDTELIANLKSEVEKANLAIEALKEKGKKIEHTDLVSQIKEWAEKNKAALANIKAGTKAELSEMTLKVNSPMTPANTYNGSAYLPQPQFEAGITDLVRVQPTFWDYIKKGATSSAAYVWVNKINPLGAAGFIGPGVLKPNISFELTTEISTAKKIAVTDKCATELLEDIPGMASYIQDEMAYQLRAKMNTTLMTGVSSSTVPAGIQTISTTFTQTGVQTSNPGNWDAVVALVAQLRSGNLMGPVTVFMNPVDYANMKLHKATSQGQLFIPGESGATIVEDNNIPIGFVQAAILQYYRVLIYKDFQVTFGWENDDFTKNLVTTIAEMRIHQFFSQNYTGFAIYDSLANIKAAITEP